MGLSINLLILFSYMILTTIFILPIAIVILTCKKSVKSSSSVKQKRCCACLRNGTDSGTSNDSKRYDNLQPLIKPLQPKTDADKEQKIKRGQLVKDKYDEKYDSMKDIQNLTELGAQKEPELNNHKNQLQLKVIHGAGGWSGTNRNVSECRKTMSSFSAQQDSSKYSHKENNKRRNSSSFGIKKATMGLGQKNSTVKLSKEKPDNLPTMDAHAYANKASRIQEGVMANPRDPLYDTFKGQTLSELEDDNERISFT